MLARFNSLFNVLLTDFKCYLKIVYRTICFFCDKQYSKRLKLKKVDLCFDKSVYGIRGELIVDGKDLFLGGTEGNIHCIRDVVPRGLRYLQYMPYFFIKPHRYNKQGDIKIIWDRCRGYHFPILALVAPNKLFEEIKKYRTILFLGYEWSSPMEVSFRAINIILSLNLLPRHIANSAPSFVSLVLHQHLEYLINNFEVDESGHTNNHYLSNLIAVELLNQILNTDNEYLRVTLISEIKKQFTEDGANFEGSTTYHFLSTELIFWLYILDEMDSSDFIETLSNAVSVCNLLLHPDGTIPLIGDNDSGAVIKLLVEIEEFKKPNVQYIYCKKNPLLIERLDNYKVRTDFFNKYFNKPVNTQKLMNTTSKLDLAGLVKIEERKFIFNNNFEIHYLHGLSIFVIKTGSQYLTVKCGPLGQLGRGGHDHHDQGSFTYCDYSSGLVVSDLGTGSYSSYYPEFFNCRGVTSHNNFMDKRQVNFDSKRPFTSVHPSGVFHLNKNILTVIVNYGEFKVARSFTLGSELLIYDFIEESGVKVDKVQSKISGFYSMYGVKI